MRRLGTRICIHKLLHVVVYVHLRKIKLVVDICIAGRYSLLICTETVVGGALHACYFGARRVGNCMSQSVLKKYECVMSADLSGSSTRIERDGDIS